MRIRLRLRLLFAEDEDEVGCRNPEMTMPKLGRGDSRSLKGSVVK